MKLQRLQNKVLRTTGKYPRNTTIRDMHISFQITYVHDYITNNAGNKPKSFNITRIYMFTILDKAKQDTENIRDLNLAVVRHMTVQVNKLVLQPELPLIGHNLLYEPGLKEA
jgi:hypothetical protein